MSIRSCFLKSFNFFDESETLIYEGGGGLIAVSKDFKWVINASDNTLNPTLFDIKGGGKTSISSGGHKKKITSLSSSFYDNVFASGDESGFLRLWNCDTFDSIGGLQVFDSSSIDAITLICLDLGHLMSLKRTKFVPPLDGYCETYIREKFCSVEHFIPCEQSKVNNYEENYDLDWQNMLAVCIPPGAIEDENVDNSQLPHKYPCCGKAKANFVPDGRLLNLLELPASRLFRFKREDGEILPDEANCEKEGIPVAFAQFTIQTLRLNVERLKTLRLAVIKKIEEELDFYDDGIIDPTVIEKQVASEYFDNGKENYPRFFTTIRWALSKGAEDHLLDISYLG